MTINILYEENMKNGYRNYTTIEIPDGDYSTMIEIDYQQRLAEAPDDKKNRVKKLDLMNKREYNNWHKEHRHRVIVNKPFRKDDEDADESDGIDAVADNSQEEEHNRQYEYEALCQKIRAVLKPEFAEVIIAVCLDDMTPEEYATLTGAKRDAIYKRLQRAKKKFREVF